MAARNDHIGVHWDADSNFNTFYASGNGGNEVRTDNHGNQLARGYYWSRGDNEINGPFTTRRRARLAALRGIKAWRGDNAIPVTMATLASRVTGSDVRTPYIPDHEPTVSDSQIATIHALYARFDSLHVRGWSEPYMWHDVHANLSLVTGIVFLKLKAAPVSGWESKKHSQSRLRHMAVYPDGKCKLLGLKTPGRMYGRPDRSRDVSIHGVDACMDLNHEVVAESHDASPNLASRETVRAQRARVGTLAWDV